MRRGDNLFVFEKMDGVHYIAVSDEGDSELSLRRQLQVLHDIRRMHTDPDGYLRKSDAVQRDFSTFRLMADAHTSALLNCIDTVNLSDDLRERITSIVAEHSVQSRLASHALLFIGTKLVLNWTRKLPQARVKGGVQPGTPQLTHTDVFLLLMHGLTQLGLPIGSDVLHAEHVQQSPSTHTSAAIPVPNSSSSTSPSMSPAGVRRQHSTRSKDRESQRELLSRQRDQNGGAVTEEDQRSDVSSDDYVSCFGDLDVDGASSNAGEEGSRLDSPADVALVQSFFRSMSLYSGEVNGRWNDECTKALQSYQRSAGLPVSQSLDSASFISVLREVHADSASGDAGSDQTGDRETFVSPSSHTVSASFGGRERERGSGNSLKRISRKRSSLTAATASESSGHGASVSSTSPQVEKAAPRQLSCRSALSLQAFPRSTSLVATYQIAESCMIVFVCNAGFSQPGATNTSEWEGCSEDSVSELNGIASSIETSLIPYMSFLAIRESTHIRMWPYATECPGLVHFVYVDRCRNAVTAPMISSMLLRTDSAAEEDAHLRWLQGAVRNMLQWGLRILWDGYTFGVVRLTSGPNPPNLQIAYHLWIQDEDGAEVPIETSVHEVRLSLIHVTSFSSQEWIRRLVPSLPEKRRRNCTVHELFSLWVSFLPCETVVRLSDQLIRTLRFAY
jgi:hypothetical protein